MLKKLFIEQFVIIDKLDLDFLPGLTVLTGETGAGKSILLDAMGLILGDPANPESIRHGSEQSIIEAVLAPAPAQSAWKFLIDNGLSTSSQQDFVIRRVIRKNGDDVILVNGKNVPLDQLKKLGTFLCEIHGQFANQSIMDPVNQLNWLDMSGAFPPEIFKNVANALAEVKRYTKELENEKDYFAKHLQGLKTIEEIVGAFNKFGMKEGFIAEVQTEYSRLLTARDTSEAFQSITAQLIASNGAIKGLSSANQVLANQKNLDGEKIAKLTEYLAVALKNARAALQETGRLTPEYDIDTKPLRRYEEILEALQKISDENSVPFDELSQFYEDMTIKADRLRNGRKRIAQYEEMLQKAKQNYRHHAHILTEKRMAAAKVLSDAITAGLPPLKLMKAEFSVLVEEKLNIPWTERGLNVVTFTARMNPGMPFSPIADTASGGELARLILALKVVLQGIQTIPTLVFDEVDTGIGGAAAAAVGERIAMLAETTQVLVITHSPQVASRGNQHLHVSKKTDGVTTTSMVRMLTLDERINEVSRMLAGDTITAESHAAAKRLIDEASTAAQSRQKTLQPA